MAQPTDTPFLIVAMTGVGTTSKTAFTNPLSVPARSAIIYNNDSTVAITVATDTSGTPSVTVAHGASFTITSSSVVLNATDGTNVNGFASGATIFNVSGNVTVQPTVAVSA